MSAKHKYKRLHEAVDWFAELMKAKLREKADDGWTGWEDAEYIEGPDNIQQIRNHVARLSDGQPQEVDIANLCMFRAFYRHLQLVEMGYAPKEPSP